jgi:hypothetical protein
MPALDSGAAMDRLRPGSPGEVIKFTFTSGSSAAQAIRAAVAFQSLAPLYISVKVTADCHIVFGGLLVGPASNADALFQAGDGWQDMLLLSDDVAFRVKGDVAGGDIYIWRSGR